MKVGDNVSYGKEVKFEVIDLYENGRVLIHSGLFGYLTVHKDCLK